MTIRDNFLPHEPSKMLKKLGFDMGCFGFYGRQFPDTMLDNLYMEQFIGAGDLSCHAPLYQQVEDWLWDTHRIDLSSKHSNNGHVYEVSQRGEILFYCPVGDIYMSPVFARRYGILAAVEYLHSQLKK